MNIFINQARTLWEIDELAQFSADTAPSVKRIVFSEQDMRARAWLKKLCLDAGLALREDAVGNLFARWIGTHPALPAVATGSHIDAIPHAGKYDGVVGVLGGLEALRALRTAGFVPKRSIELILFTSEEPTRFGIGCLGSRLLSGMLGASADESLHDSAGDTLKVLRDRAGLSGHLNTVRLPQDAYSAFVELHIEQGPILENEGVPIGLVTHIAAPASFRIDIQGEGGHAGGRLMAGRRDALCAAAELILAAEGAALESGASDTVATVGMCDVHPGAVNSIPSSVGLSLDLRDTDQARRESVQRRIEAACRVIEDKRSVDIRCETINADPPAQSSPTILRALTAACEQEKFFFRSMVSRAYHDTLFMSRIAPVAMLFIPCRGGISHRPDEFAKAEDISAGTLVLARALATLSSEV